jgi:hypothetical protein
VVAVTAADQRRAGGDRGRGCALCRAERGPPGRCPLDVWWQYPTPAEPEQRPSRLPFHEVPNVLITPHSSSSTEATADRRWSAVTANLDPLDARADAAQPEGPHRMGPDQQARGPVAAKAAHPSPVAQPPLRRQTSKVAAGCGNAARPVLCGGRLVISIPTAIRWRAGRRSLR